MNEMESVGSKKYLRIGIYLRLSNEDRDKANKEETSESIKNQRNMLIDYINRHPEFVLIDEYSMKTYPELELIDQNLKD